MRINPINFDNRIKTQNYSMNFKGVKIPVEYDINFSNDDFKTGLICTKTGNIVKWDIYQGRMNDQKASFDITSKDSINSNNIALNGMIDDCIVYLNQKDKSLSGLSNNKKIEGFYEGNKIDLKLKKKLYSSKMELKGKIGTEEVEYKFPGSDVPFDNSRKNIITLILIMNGFLPKSSNGIFLAPEKNIAIVSG